MDVQTRADIHAENHALQEGVSGTAVCTVLDAPAVLDVYMAVWDMIWSNLGGKHFPPFPYEKNKRS